MTIENLKIFKKLNLNSLREIFAPHTGKNDPILAVDTEDLLQQFDRLEEKSAEYALSLSSKKLNFFIQIAKKSENFSIKRRLIALLYRGEFEKPLDALPPLYLKLYDYALEWKKQHPLIGHALLTAHEIDQIKIASSYPLFSLLLDEKSFRDQFLEWVLQDENESIPFIEFPATIERLKKAKLNGRISRLSHNPLQIVKQNSTSGILKYLTLPFEGKPESIVDPEALIQFKGAYALKIAEIFETFSRKDIAVGHLEFMQEGIVNWNIHHLGYWDNGKQEVQKIDIHKNEWWKSLPNYRILTRRQIAKRFQINVSKQQWVVAAAATRGKPTLDFEDTHAFLEIAVPIKKGHYALYDFGKLAFKYPETTLDKLKMLTQTVHATVAYPDENVFYTHRQHGLAPFLITPRQGKILMETIAKDIENARHQNFVYQIESENCAKWVFQTLETVIKEMPDIFRMNLLDTEPEGPVKHIFQWIKKLPERWQVPVLTFLHIPLGAKRKVWVYENNQLVSKSLATHSFFNTGEIFLPALLIAKIAISMKALATHWLGRFKNISKNWMKRVYFSAYGLQFMQNTWSKYSPIHKSLQGVRSP